MGEQTLAPVETAAVVPGVPDSLAGVNLGRAFPSAEKVSEAASLIPAAPCGHVQEGPSWRVTVSPGKVKVWTVDEARAERRDNVSPIEDYSSCQPQQLDLGLDGGTGDPDDVRRERQRLEMHSRAADAMAVFLAERHGTEQQGTLPERTPSREITGWSSKSRARMTERMCDLDYSPLFDDPTRLAGMLTLTYSKCWQRVAPNGKAVKKHLKELRKRYKRHFGEELLCVWKQELQGRQEYVWRGGELVENWCRCEFCAPYEDGRAPHVHMLMRPPHQRSRIDNRTWGAWVAFHWADIVDHPDPEEKHKHWKAGTGMDWNEGLRATDPRRVAVYFTKHGGASGKEYQHCVPLRWREPGQGPGRFWGYWGLKPKYATTAVTNSVGIMAGRIIRRYSRASGHTTMYRHHKTGPAYYEERQPVTRQVRRPRTKGGRPIPKYHDVIGLAGAQLIQSREVAPGQFQTTYRATRTRTTRLKNGRGWISLNDAPAFAEELAFALNLAIIQ